MELRVGERGREKDGGKEIDKRSNEVVGELFLTTQTDTIRKKMGEKKRGVRTPTMLIKPTTQFLPYLSRISKEPLLCSITTAPMDQPISLLDSSLERISPSSALRKEVVEWAGTV